MSLLQNFSQVVFFFVCFVKVGDIFNDANKVTCENLTTQCTQCYLANTILYILGAVDKLRQIKV